VLSDIVRVFSGYCHGYILSFIDIHRLVLVWYDILFLLLGYQLLILLVLL
jgi:hypothetical protein